MKERVTTIRGQVPVILVAPHGPDDSNTDIITRSAQKILDCYAVINNGFERGDKVDSINSIADCNRVDHCTNDEVVYQEFMEPFLGFVDVLEKKLIKEVGTVEPVIHVFYIHGCGNHVHKTAGKEVEIILGYGLGNQRDSLTYNGWRKNAFVNTCRSLTSGGLGFGEFFEGKGGGKYAGKDSNNMNQYFRKHSENHYVQSMQLEFPASTRANDIDAMSTGEFLAEVIKRCMNLKQYNEKQLAYFI
jgi:hypothetical protein